MRSFDRIIQEKTSSHEAPVPPNAWENISKKKTKRRFVFFWFILAAILVGVGGIIFKAGHEDQVSQPSLLSGNPDRGSKADGDVQAVPSMQLRTLTSSNNTSLSDNAQKAVLKTKEDKVQNHFNTSHEKLSKPEKNNIVENLKTSAPRNNLTSLTNVNVKRDSKRIGYKAKTSATVSSPGAEETSIDVVHNESVVVDEPVISKGSSITVVDENIALQTSPSPTTGKKEADNVATEKNKNIPLKKKRARYNGWQVELSATPMFTINQQQSASSISRIQSNGNTETKFVSTKMGSDMLPAFAFSLSAKKQFSKKLYAGLGLQYLELKEQLAISGKETKTQYNVVHTLINGPGGPQLIDDTVQTITEGTRQINATNSYQVWSVPLFIQYKLIQRPSWSLLASAGVNVNIAAKYRNEIDKNSTASLITQGEPHATKLGADLTTGLRFAKSAGRRIEIFALPAMRWSLGSYYIKNSLFAKKTQQAVISFGIAYKMN